jgi:hypothetical protein
MNEQESLQSSPQLARYEQRAFALSPKQIHSLYKKSKASGVDLAVLEEVYCRGFSESNKEQTGFNRVDSFIHGGEAFYLDQDLVTEGLLKRLRKGLTKVAVEMGKDVVKTAFPHPSKAISRYKKAAQKAMKEDLAEPQSTNKNEPSSRFVGTDSCVNILRNDTPGQSRANLIKRVVKDKAKGK